MDILKQTESGGLTDGTIDMGTGLRDASPAEAGCAEGQFRTAALYHWQRQYAGRLCSLHNGSPAQRCGTGDRCHSRRESDTPCIGNAGGDVAPDADGRGRLFAVSGESGEAGTASCPCQCRASRLRAGGNRTHPCTGGVGAGTGSVSGGAGC